MTRPSGWSALAAVLAMATPATARTIAAGPAAQGLEEDGRLLGHFPYPQADAADLASAPPGFAIGQPCRVHAAMLADLARLLDAAAGAAMGETLHGLSCYRSVARQQAVFCRTAAACADAVLRAGSVGPPGHSEHATGYAIDFATRPSHGCADVADCFADTTTGRWLLANAPAYGFELSFPRGNAQGVTYEPWHWRWAGTSQDEPGAAIARAAFATARTSYPARPEQAGFALRPLPPPDPSPPDPSLPVTPGETPPPVDRH